MYIPISQRLSTSPRIGERSECSRVFEMSFNNREDGLADFVVPAKPNSLGSFSLRGRVISFLRLNDGKLNYYHVQPRALASSASEFPRAKLQEFQVPEL